MGVARAAPNQLGEAKGEDVAKTATMKSTLTNEVSLRIFGLIFDHHPSPSCFDVTDACASSTEGLGLGG